MTPLPRNHISEAVRWHLHLGAHKTATTHIQQTLAAASLQAGFVPLKELRSATSELFETRRTIAKLKFPPAVKALVGRCELAVLSEENWLGQAWEGCAFPPYAELDQRLDIVGTLRGPKRAFLAIRHPADYAASVYSEALRHHPSAVALEDVKARWLAGGSPWFDVAQRIARHFPLRVWQFEDYRANSGAILTELTGEAGPFPDVPDPPATMRLTQEMIDATERARAAGEPLVALRHLPRTGETRFEMFSEAERGELGQAYAADIARIESELPGVLMRF